MNISPGPWTLSDDSLTITDANGLDVCVGCTSPKTISMDLKNAVLIASAPEMLRALIEIGNSDSAIPSRIKKLMEDAIMKAMEDI